MNRVKKYLGIDWGEKRIGLALGDNETKLALPFATVSNIRDLMRIIIEEEIDELVLGDPQKMNGGKSNNPAWLMFKEYLEKNIKKEIHLIDERLSSLGADSLEGKKSDKAGRDEIAASIILQNYLDLLT